MKIQRKYTGVMNHALVLEAESQDEARGLSMLREAIRFWVPGSAEPNGRLSEILAGVEIQHREQLAAEEARRQKAEPMPPEMRAEEEGVE